MNKIGKKIIPVIIVLLVQSQFIAQNLDSIPSPKLHLGITGSADWGYRQISAIEPTTEEYVGIKENTEFAAFGYTIGLRMRYDFTERYSLDAGVSFAARGYDGFGPITNSGFLPGENVRNFYYFNYVEVPLQIHYNFPQVPANPFFGFGFSLNSLTKGEHRTVIRDEIGFITDESTTFNNSEINAFGASLIVSAGVNLKRSERLFVRLEPTFTYQLNSIWKTGYQERLFAGGVKITIMMNQTKLYVPGSYWEQDEDWETW